MQINIKKRSIGVDFGEEKQAQVTVWSPPANRVSIIVSEESIPLSKDEYGYWNTTTDRVKPGDAYKFKIDEKPELPDPASLYQPEGVHGSSEAVDLHDYSWNDAGWKNPELKDYIIYELHTGTFSASSDFKGVEERLDYLVELGVTAIEIMPVAQFPGNRNWGYDGVFPFAVQNSYGGPRALQRLVDACHAKGIAVILDVVYNHLGPEGNYLNEFGPYFTDKYGTPWGKAINFDDAWCDGVRHYFIENVLMWFRDFHIDALRMDAVHAIKDFSPIHILREIREYVDQLMETTGRKHYLIVECDLNDTRFINSKEEGGFGMDAQWIDEFHHSLRVTAGEEPTGYYADFEGIAHLAKAYKDAYVYDGQYSPHRNKKFGVKTENKGQQFVVFSQNHDQVGNRMLGERTSQLVSFEMQKLMAGAVMVGPYLPMMFMGEEFGAPSPFLYFISHGDPQLVEAVRKGRKAEFEAFHAKGEAPDPQSEEIFKESQLDWSLVKPEPHSILLHFYKTLIRLRKQHPVLQHTDRKKLQVQFDEEQKVLLLSRWHLEHKLVCLMNFSVSEQNVVMPSSNLHWNLLLNSADPQWGGKVQAEQNPEAGAPITLPGESILIYSNH